MTESGQQLTLIAQLKDVVRNERSLAQGYQVRQIEHQDRLSLADLYFAVYPRDIVADVAAACDEMEQTFTGAYGQLDMVASPMLRHNHIVVGAVMTVESAPWPDTPVGPFIIEVMVHPAYQRLGIAAYLIQWTARNLIARGKRTMALRVMSDNTGARALYDKLGFESWDV
ncbi:MAG: GNAT family N-acetyltransferase [Chloroflexota bacterium]